MKKLLNVFGILVAWLLSIALVVMLIVTPILFSALSLLNADTITKVVTDTLSYVADHAGGEPSAENAQVMTLSNTNQSASAEDAGKDMLESVFGDKISQEHIEAILSSNAAKELIEAYTDDLTNAITGGSQEASFNADKIKSIVNNNIDEIVEGLQKNIPELADTDVAELKSNIQKAVEENAEEIVNALPKPEEIKEQLIDDNPVLEAAIEIIAMKNTIKLAVIGVIVLLSVLIFVCRIPRLRGFRWLAVNLFIGGGFAALVTSGLMAGKSAIGEFTKEADAQLAGLVESLVGAFANGMLVRTIVMLVAGGVLLTAYILINRFRTKKTVATEEIPLGETQV